MACRHPLTSRFVLLAAVASLPIWGMVAPALAGDDARAEFDRQVAPILIANCLGCHSGRDPMGGLDLTRRRTALAGGDSGPVIVRGKPDESLLLQRLREGSMPPEEEDNRLGQEQVALLEKWIAAGANWPEARTLSPYELTTAKRAGYDWWSLQPVRRPTVPQVQAKNRVATPIDAFLLARLEEHRLGFGPPADRRTLIRRATFDLIGLPPTPEEFEAFLADDSPAAYKKLIERLLASPHYGERWGRHWLDVVRYSESMGFERDRIRDHAWRYRDWVIKAFNDDMPYDEFVRRQLAADALDPGDPEAVVATGFLVTGPNNDVGNRSELEAMRDRMDELDDFITDTSAVFLGLTVGCARCHDHKFDPIPSRDYYRLAAALGGVHYGDRVIAEPALKKQHDKRIADFDARITALREQDAALQRERDKLNTTGVAIERNEHRFEPVEARLVRLTILKTTGGDEPCIDELEIYGPEGDENLALASAGAVASASSLLPGYDIHQVAHLNEGRYGNAHSWISNEAGGGWAQIELAAAAPVARVVWGRDREEKYRDRLASAYRIEVSRDGDEWRTVFESSAQKLNEIDASKVQQIGGRRKTLGAKIAAFEKEKAGLPKLTVGWAVISKKPPPVHLLNRGDVRSPGEEVSPGALSAIGTLEADLSVADDAEEPKRRLALARWLSSPANPLAARVMVNRIWHYHFGTGIVDTPSDFGFGGGRPSHPKLLDWLADEFVASGWSIKHMHRRIMLSAAYRQSWRHDEQAESLDGDNRLLWRTARRRIEAETLRDAILATSGTLNQTMGRPGYRQFVYIEGNIPVYEWRSANEPDTWRRTVYRHVIRSHSSPFLDLFDCPDSSVMTPRRARTTTPLQALSLLNNEFVVDQAARFAERLQREAGDDLAAAIRRAWSIVYGRPPGEDEVQQAAQFAETHGMAGLCRVLWNSNEFLYVD